jgi:hypothetical protein
MRKVLLNSGKKISSKIRNGSRKIKTKIQKTNETFKEKFTEARQKPVSKRKSILLGFSTVLGIFSITLLALVLPAIAKDGPGPKPNEICPAPAQTFNKEVGKALSLMAATVCGLAVSTGSFAVGIVCGLIVGGGILHAQGK